MPCALYSKIPAGQQCTKSDHDELGPVEIQDSTSGLIVIQALDGTIRTDGRPMGEDGTALPG
mgnify:CR=1 FL=1